jgi:cell division protein FtsW
MKNKNKIDKPFLFTVISLLSIGCIMVVSTSSVVGFANYQDSYFFIRKHFIYIALGFVWFILGIYFPHKKYKEYLPYIICFSLLLLIGPFIKGIGVSVGGASRWVNLGFFQFQPVEVSKFAIIVFIATYLDNKKENIRNLVSGVFPLFFMVGVYCTILFMQPDLGNVLVITSIMMGLLVISRAKIEHLLGTMLLGLSGIIYNIFTHAYQLERIKSFLSPWSDPLGRNYHAIQSFIAIGLGGFQGLGLGQSKLKYFYLPLHYSDFIFSILCEEGGFILGAAVIALFSVLFFRGILISSRATNEYSYYLGIGLTLLLVIQAILNIGVVIGVFPITGVTLTFISFGGTSLIISMFCAGVVLNISKTNDKKN